MKKLWFVAAAAVMTAAVAVTASAEKITMRLAHYAAVDHPGGIAAQQFADAVKERTNGDITAADLLKVSPFCDMDIMGLFGPAKFGYVKQLISGLHKPVM